MKTKITSLTLPISLITPFLISAFIGLCLVSFFVPFILGHPQWLVGTIVNASLFLSAIFLPWRMILPIVIFPSLGVLSRGIIFGPFTFFLTYFLPFIWLGNFILILVFRKFFLYFNFLISLFLAASAKFLVLFLSAYVYFKFSIVPSAFLQLMGFNQLLTALGGGLIAWIIFLSYKNAKS